MTFKTNQMKLEFQNSPQQLTLFMLFLVIIVLCFVNKWRSCRKVTLQSWVGLGRYLTTYRLYFDSTDNESAHTCVCMCVFPMSFPQSHPPTGTIVSPYPIKTIAKTGIHTCTCKCVGVCVCVYMHAKKHTNPHVQTDAHKYTNWSPHWAEKE